MGSILTGQTNQGAAQQGGNAFGTTLQVGTTDNEDVEVLRNGVVELAFDGTDATFTNDIVAPNLSGSNTGDQTITLTGEVTGSGTGSFSTTLANSGVVAGTYGDDANSATITLDVKGRATSVTETPINHDALLNYVANQHIDHTTVSVLPGTGLTGGGTIAADRTLTVDIASGANVQAGTAGKILDGTAVIDEDSFASDSDQKVPTQQSVKAYVLANSSAGAVTLTGAQTITGAKTFSAQPVGITGSSIVNTPAGNIASSDVQGALNELDTEKAALGGAVFTGAISATNLSGSNTGDQTITLTGDIAGTGTGSFSTDLSTTGVTAGSYGSTFQSPSYSVDAKGRIAAATNVTIDHNALDNYVADQHVDHSTLSILAGTGLTGGGDLLASRTLTVDIATGANISAGTANKIVDASSVIDEDSFASDTNQKVPTQQSTKAYVDAQILTLASALKYRGALNAGTDLTGTSTGNSYVDSGVDYKVGDYFKITSSGAVTVSNGTITVETGDSLIINVAVAHASIVTSGVDTIDADDGSAVTTVFGRIGAVVATSGDYTASQVTNVASGNIVATTVQTAINELDTEKAALSGATFTGSISSTNLSGTNTGDQTITLTGDVTGSGTGSFAATLAASGVTANTYGSATQVPVITIDAKGRATSVTNTSISSVTLAAGTTGTDVNFSTGTVAPGGTLTLNIPDASATARGLVTTGTQTFAGDKTFNGSLVLGDASGDSVTVNASTMPTPNGLNMGSGTFYIDPTNKYVGVNTAVPLAPLHVTRTSGTSSHLRLTNVAFGVSNEVFLNNTAPESTVTGSVGDVAIGASTGRLYVKRTGTASTTGWGDVSSSFIGGTAAATTAATQYIGVFADNVSATEANVALWPVPFTGVIKNLRARVQTAPGAGNTWTFTVRVNGVASSVTCSITGSISTGSSDLVNSVAVSAGDVICCEMLETGTATATRSSWEAEYYIS